MTDHRLLLRSEIAWKGLRSERDPDLDHVRRGVHGPADGASDLDARHLRVVRASHLTLTGLHVHSHGSAAVLLGLPVLGARPTKIHLVDERRSGGRSRLDVVRHRVERWTGQGRPVLHHGCARARAGLRCGR